MEAIRSAFEVERGTVETKEAIDGILVEQGSNDARERAADVLWLLHVEDQAREDEGSNKEERSARRASLCKEILQKDPGSRHAMLRLLPHQTLQDASLVRDAEDLKTREKRMNTKFQYIQVKANLMAEASEGYSKFLLALFHVHAGSRLPQSQVDWERDYQLLLEIVGRFSLDANRCAPLLLDAMQAFPEGDFAIFAMRRFRREGWDHILGNAFQAYQGDTAHEKRTPHSLFRVAARLLADGLVTLEGLWPYLSPGLEETEQLYEEDLKARQASVRNCGRVSLASVASSATSVTRSALPSLNQTNKRIVPGGLLEDGWCAFNQRVGILQSVLDLGDWAIARCLLGTMSRFEVEIYPPVSFALLKTLSLRVDGKFSKLHLEPNMDSDLEPSSFALREFFGSECSDIMDHCNHILGMEPTLFAKVCRCVKVFVSQPQGKSSQNKLIEAQAFLANFVLPSLSVAPPLPAMSKEVWGALSEFSFTARCKIYTNWKANMSQSTWLSGATASAVSEIKKILRRISNDEEVIKRMKPAVAKLTHSNPFAVFEAIVSQIEFYSNMIDPIVKSLGLVTDLGFDVLTMVIMQRLTMPGREKMKEDGINVADWLQSLSLFCGSVCRSYPGVGLIPILQLLTARLRKGDTLNLVVLRQIISQVGGLDVIEEVSGAYISTLSPKIRFFVTACERDGAHEDSLRHLQRLGRALTHSCPGGSPLAVPLLVLLAQQTCAAAYHSKGEFLKVVGNLYDICQQTFLQYSEVLGNAFHSSGYTKETLPRIEHLLSSFGLAPEAVWHMYRPFMDDIKHELVGYARTGSGKAHAQASVLPEGFNLAALQEVIPAFIPDDVAPDCSKELFLAFWTFGLQDIYVSDAEFTSKLGRLQASLETFKSSPMEKQRASKASASALSKAIEIMKDEYAKMVCNRDAVIKWLKDHMNNWFNDNVECCTQAFLQLCILPRAKMSPRDALYCSRFIMLLAIFDAKNFSLSIFLDNIVEKIPYVLMASSELEASRLGVIYKDVFSWLGTLSFAVKKSFSALPGSCKPSSSENFLQQTIHWYSKLTKILATFCSSKEYMNIRNTLILLAAGVKVFPLLESLSEDLERSVRAAAEDESRQDIKMQANMYLQALKQQQHVMFTEEEFKERMQEWSERDMDIICKEALEGEFQSMENKRPVLMEDAEPHPSAENGQDSRECPDSAREGNQEPQSNLSEKRKSAVHDGKPSIVAEEPGAPAATSEHKSGDQQKADTTTKIQASTRRKTAKDEKQAKTELKGRETGKHPSSEDKTSPGSKRKGRDLSLERGVAKRQRSSFPPDARETQRGVMYTRHEERDTRRDRDHRFSRKRSRSPPPHPKAESGRNEREKVDHRSSHATRETVSKAGPGPPRNRQKRRN